MLRPILSIFLEREEIERRGQTIKETSKIDICFGELDSIDDRVSSETRLPLYRKKDVTFYQVKLVSNRSVVN